MAYRNALLRNTRLYESLVKSIPDNFEELIQKTEKYARLEEEKKSTVPTGIVPTGQTVASTLKPGNAGGESSSHGKKRFRTDDRSRTFYPLCKPLDVILRELKMNPAFKLPPPFPQPPEDKPGVNMRQYCEYHQYKGHRTAHCRTLRARSFAYVKSGSKATRTVVDVLSVLGASSSRIF